MLQREPNVLRVTGKVVIIGDIHGQYYDLLEILRKIKFGKTNKKLVFMGDYVDRGKNQPEVFALLFGLKIRYPNSIYLMRGNHETRDCTERYDFREQMLVCYDVECYEAVMDVFDQLPVASIVNGEFLAVHGGISSRCTSIDQLNQIMRKQEPPNEDCIFNDLLWADPIAGDEAVNTGEVYNESRKTSVKFGLPVLQ